MDLLPLFNVIIHHFMQSHVSNIVVFNCWKINAQLTFLQNANNQLLRTQMVDISKEVEFPGGYLNGRLTSLGVVLDFNCNMSGYILNEASQKQLYLGKYNWLIFDMESKYSELKMQFENAMMAMDAQITYSAINKANLNSSKLSFLNYDVFNNGKFLGGKLNITLNKEITCDKDSCTTSYLSGLELRPKAGNRCNLNDTTFRISTVTAELPLNSSTEAILYYLLTDNSTHKEPLSRYSYKIVFILQQMMHYKVHYIHRYKWSDNETAGGSFGDIPTGNAELSGCGYVPTEPRLKIVSVVSPMGDFKSIFIFRTPQNQGLYGGVFLSPFSTAVWIAFAAVILGFAVLLWAIFAIEFRIKKYVEFIPSLLLTFLISFGLACFQGAALIPCTAGGRIAFFSLSVVTFIMYNYYTSIVVSSLVGAPIKSNIKTLGQLADSNLEIGFDPIIHTKVFLNISTNPGVKKLVQKKVAGRWAPNSGLWQHAKDGIFKVRDGGYAYHSEASTSYYMVEKYYEQHELCDLNEVKLRTESTLNIMMAKNSSYKELVRLSMMRMREAGVLSKHRRHWMKTKLNCFSNNILINVGLEYTGPLFAFLGLTYIVTVIILLFEVGYHKYADNNIKKVKN
ncbi:ionotropic receptor 75a-like [Eupeodes corollae]|uniref:ionotropic receptor 75a-like n=1 Tax=Eupeodes corollae TaxID=290404 RepID=UPI00248F635B|nr:ionotropic receptor 75a-like [Eupeodes corollae]